MSGLILTKCSLRHCHFVFLVQTGCAKFVKTNRIGEFLDKKTDCTHDCVTGMMSQDVTGCHSCESASPYLNQICPFYFSCLKLNGVVTVARFCSFYSDFFESVMALPSDMLRHLCSLGEFSRLIRTTSEPNQTYCSFFARIISC